MANEFVMLGHSYDPKKHFVGNWFASEKLDGVRCIWDGGVSRGLKKEHVPWANCTKDARFRAVPLCTGLWSRYGHPIQAPDWFLDALPSGQALDGELYIRGPRQQLLSVVKDLVPGSGWQRVGYWVFDIPSPEVTRPRKCTGWLVRENGLTHSFKECCSPWQFIHNVDKLNVLSTKFHVPWLHFLEQTRLPDPPHEKVSELLTAITSQGGEGLVLRAPYSMWETARSRSVLKVKLIEDSEGKVVGYVGGRGKYEGMIGAFVLELAGGRRLELSGFTDHERAALYHLAPGKEATDKSYSAHFPLGSVLTFKYRGLSQDGIPQEARYWRKWSMV